MKHSVLQLLGLVTLLNLEMRSVMGKKFTKPSAAFGRDVRRQKPEEEFGRDVRKAHEKKGLQDNGVVPPTRLTGLPIIGETLQLDSTALRKALAQKLQTSKGSPIYQAGFDKQYRPLWIFDFETLPFANLVAMKKTENVLGWQNKLMDEIETSIVDANAVQDERNVTGITAIFDLGGNFMSIFGSPTMMSATKVLLDNFGEHSVANTIEDGLFINLSPIAALMLESLGIKTFEFVKKLRYYGTDQTIWKPELLKIANKDQLPPEYGGEDSFIPEALYPIKGSDGL